MRETVNAATCKSEELNNFLQWIFFYNSGIIQENLRHEQTKIVKYNHLVANLIILHNVNAMTRVLKRLKRNDFDVTPEMLAALSPYRTSHINLLGQYPLETNRTMHRAFVKATGNMFLLENFDGIWNRGISIQTFKTLDPPRLAKSLQGHMALCDAIETGNFDIAQKTMHEHIAEGCELQLTAL